jgi:hypothetical protein
MEKHEEGFKFIYSYGYMVIKHNNEEKAKLIHEFLTNDYKFENNFTRDMLNCKYDCTSCTSNNRFIENKTPLNLICQHGTDILILLDKVDDFIGEYKYQNTVRNYEIDIRTHYNYEKNKENCESLINKIKQYKEDREKSNKLIGRNF